MHFVGGLFAGVAHDRSNLVEGSHERNGVLRVVGVDNRHSAGISGEVHHRHETDCREDTDCRGNNIVQLEVLERQVHVLAGLLDIGVEELLSRLNEFLIDILGFSGRCHCFCPPCCFLLFGLDTQKVIDSLSCHVDVELLVHIGNGQVVIVVDDTMLREHFDFGGRLVLSLDFEQLPVSLVCRCIYPVHSLYRDLYAIDKVICFTIFRPSLCNNLELENIVTAIDGVFHGCTVNEVLSESGRNDTAGIVDFPSTHAGNALDKIAALFFDLSARLHFDIVVHILLRNLHHGVFFQLKAGALLPLVTDFRGRLDCTRP